MQNLTLEAARIAAEYRLRKIGITVNESLAVPEIQRAATIKMHLQVPWDQTADQAETKKIGLVIINTPFQHATDKPLPPTLPISGNMFLAQERTRLPLDIRQTEESILRSKPQEAITLFQELNTLEQAQNSLDPFSSAPPLRAEDQAHLPDNWTLTTQACRKQVPLDLYASVTK